MMFDATLLWVSVTTALRRYIINVAMHSAEGLSLTLIIHFTGCYKADIRKILKYTSA